MAQQIYYNMNFVEQYVTEQRQKPPMQNRLPLEIIMRQFEEHAQQQQQQPGFQNLSLETVTELVAARHVEHHAEQMANNIRVPVVQLEMNVAPQGRERFYLRKLIDGLYAKLNPFNLFGQNHKRGERQSASVNMMEWEYHRTFFHLPQYYYRGRKMRNVPWELTKLVTREQFLATFGENARWHKRTRKYTIYLRFPVMLTYNTASESAQFHYMVDIFDNSDGHKVQQNFSKTGPKKCVTTIEECTTTVRRWIAE